MKHKESHIVPKQEKPIRLSDYLAGVFASISSKQGVKKAIKKGQVQLNGTVAKTGDFLSGGENIELFCEVIKATMPEVNLKIEVVYEDDYLAVVIKPAGIVVSGNKARTLENALTGNLRKSESDDALIKPEPVHRLDYPTSGAILIAKTRMSLVLLNKLFEERKVEKTYMAITIGVMDENGLIENTIDNKSATTKYKVLSSVSSERFECLNLVQLMPSTGRRHQLRKHMADNRNPILGDKQYGAEGLILMGKGLYLHAYALVFEHPVIGKRMDVSVDVPEKFVKIFPDLELKNIIKYQ